MDTLYYSNYCKHSQRVLHFIVKGNLSDKLNFLCIDKREKDVNNNQTYILLENGKRVVMPPNIQSVPALLLVKHGYRVLLGDDIIQHFQGAANLETKKKMMNQHIEPVGTSLGSGYVSSEQYTSFHLTPDELSAKGNGGRRQLYNYVSANEEIISIQTPPDTYQADKIDQDVTVDKLQQTRMDEIQTKPNYAI
jgi:hypothetical protein